MKKKIAILGSTGSIGKTLINIIKENPKAFEVKLLTSNKNYRLLLKQAKELKVKNVIICNSKSYNLAKQITKYRTIKIFNNFDSYKKIFKKKIDYTMSAIVGIAGLKPTINIIKHTNKIVIANKESIICGWNLIKNEILKYRVDFIPADSEHFSIWYSLRHNNDKINRLFITASGGPFIDYPLKKFNKIEISDATSHPNWRMGKKISVDSATMMNKVFEVIEANKIFDLNYKKISILTHPSSYVHSLIHFQNGLIKIIAHDTNMKIPIMNTINNNFKLKNFSTTLNLEKLNNLKLTKINIKKFPSVKILSMLNNKNSLFDTIVVSANDELVNLFLNKKIKFNQISTNLLKLLKSKEFIKYKQIKPKNIDDIIKLNNYVRLKINSKSI